MAIFNSKLFVYQRLICCSVELFPFTHDEALNRAVATCGKRGCMKCPLLRYGDDGDGPVG